MLMDTKFSTLFTSDSTLHDHTFSSSTAAVVTVYRYLEKHHTREKKIQIKYLENNTNSKNISTAALLIIVHSCCVLLRVSLSPVGRRVFFYYR